MTGSVALDVVIGLIFIYLLYSLLATVVCEIIATHWGLRARNLLYSIERMLEDSPKQSETKVKALLNQLKESTIRLFDTPEGPASCVFYRLPVIKYLAKNTFHSKPSYITRQTFSKALFEIFRIYGGANAASDLEKIRNVLNGSLEHQGVLKLMRDEIVKSTQGIGAQAKKPPDYSVIYDKILEIKKAQERLPTDATQAKLYKKIQKLLDKSDKALRKKSDKNPEKKSNKSEKDVKKDVVYQIDEMLNLFGHETRSHMRSLLKDSNDDLLKFRLHLEQWFDDTQDRAAGWYKQQVQVLLLIIGLAFAAFFNANTVDIVHKLSIDKDARDKMVQLASDYLKDPNSIRPNTNGEPPKDSSQINDNARIDSLKKVQAKLQKQIDDANSLVGAGWPELSDSLSLWEWTEDNLAKVSKDDGLHYSVIELDQGESGKFVRKILVYPNTMTDAVLGCIEEAIVWGAERYKGFNPEMTKIKVETGLFGTLLYMATTFFSKAFWGFLLTAIAISLGAPFWFDLLNKLMQIRGSVREPTQTHSGTAAAGTGTSDPAHPINRKG